MSQDENLRLLVVFHYLLAALTALISCVPLIFVGVGATIIFHPESMTQGHGHPPPPFFGWMIASLGVTFLIMGWAYAICLFLAGRFLKSRNNYTFCLVIAGLSCMWMPFGTVLGIFTLLVLLTPEVKALFAHSGGPA